MKTTINRWIKNLDKLIDIYRKVYPPGTISKCGGYRMGEDGKWYGRCTVELPEFYYIAIAWFNDEKIPTVLEWFYKYEFITGIDGSKLIIEFKYTDFITVFSNIKKINIIKRETNSSEVIDNATFDNLVFHEINTTGKKITYRIN